MTLYTFAIKELRQYLKHVNLIQVNESESLFEQRLETTQDVKFGKRIVLCFLKGNFTVAEMNVFDDLADSASAAPPAKGYFQHYQSGVEVHTDGLSIQNLAVVPPVIREFAQEYTNGKLLDEGGKI